MTATEFDKKDFNGLTKFDYNGNVYEVRALNFDERLIGYNTEYDDNLSWVRCENVTIIQ